MQRKLTFHDMSGTGTKKIFRLQMSYTNEISNGDPVIKMKALNILKFTIICLEHIKKSAC